MTSPGHGGAPQRTRILVTGAAGLLGAEVDSGARSRGHEVVALARADLDVTDERAVRAAIRAARPTSVVHCAAYTAVDRAESEPELARALNRDAARSVALAAAEQGASFVYLSTDYVFDGRERRPYLPGDETAPLSVYGRTKLEGEQAVQEVASGALVIRTSWLYGDGKGFVPAILRRAAEGGPLRIVDDQHGRPTWARGAAAGVLDLLEGGARGLWHVADGGECSWLELAQEALRLRGVATPVEAISTEDFGAPAARPRYSVLDLTATEEFLGRKMTDWRVSLARFLGET